MGGGPAEPAGPAITISPMTLIICFCKNSFKRLSPQGAGRIPSATRIPPGLTKGLKTSGVARFQVNPTPGADRGHHPESNA